MSLRGALLWAAAIVVLLGLAILAFGNPLRSTRHGGAQNWGDCKKNEAQLYDTLWSFAAAHGDWLPDCLEQLTIDWPPMLHCPVLGLSEGAASHAFGADYVYLGAGLKAHEIVNLKELPLLFDRWRNHPDRTRNVLFCDRRILTVREEDVVALMRKAMNEGRYNKEVLSLILPSDFEKGAP